MNGHTVFAGNSLQPQLHVALKEWATVCSALQQGRQILLLRKGGIHESAGEFELEHSQFLLFPTYLHQNKEMLKSAEHAGLTPATAEPSQITLSVAGVVTDIIRVRNRAQIDALDAQHIWTRPLIDMRFYYKPQNPLYLVLVRAWQLPHPVNVENTPQYAGCKSWVPLTQSVATAGARPVLEDAQYEHRRQRLIDALETTP